QGIYLLYPNMFIVLVGPPGKVGKSTSLRMGRNILEGVDDIQWSADSLTREELRRRFCLRSVLIVRHSPIGEGSTR
ncbi:unnamed protein product, partial [marine sediment metagenome]